ncbi:hypothetical protein C8F04DRAFT_1189447 [Mycena alexandri]|uniref:Uncharacterized protein n=1 Tax=Mycena alexandri TaxID=1745969 RepID=A0AAD6SKV6_9AGAR|nr:hypothetical protein C8F04DRAFT_1189447 [Mycena alexandri]
MALIENAEEMVDGRVRDRIINYTKFWDKDISKEKDERTVNRVNHYKSVVNGNMLAPQDQRFYDGATELYEYGWAQSFHFCRFHKGEAFLAALARHEHYLPRRWGCARACTTSPWFLAAKATWAMELLRLVPKRTYDVGEALGQPRRLLCAEANSNRKPDAH